LIALELLETLGELFRRLQISLAHGFVMISAHLVHADIVGLEGLHQELLPHLCLCKFLGQLLDLPLVKDSLLEAHANRVSGVSHIVHDHVQEEVRRVQLLLLPGQGLLR
jgi:hypothetical protein